MPISLRMCSLAKEVSIRLGRRDLKRCFRNVARMRRLRKGAAGSDIDCCCVDRSVMADILLKKLPYWLARVTRLARRRLHVLKRPKSVRKLRKGSERRQDFCQKPEVWQANYPRRLHETKGLSRTTTRLRSPHAYQGRERGAESEGDRAGCRGRYPVLPRQRR